MPRKRIKIVEKKLGRDNVHGWAIYKPELRIELDERLRGKFQQEVLLHEGLHIVFPHLDEEAVLEAAHTLAELTWKFGLRRIQPPYKSPSKASTARATQPANSRAAKNPRKPPASKR